MLKALLVSNLRSFTSETEIELRPITVLLGRNSSGKSTITRLMPLYQQSFDQRTSAPILWNGGLVDFGSVADVRPRTSAAAPTTLGFKINLDTERFQSSLWFFNNTRVFYDHPEVTYKATLNDYGDEGYRRTRLARLQLEVNHDKIVLDFADNGKVAACQINDKDYSELVEKAELYADVQSFFPQIRSRRKVETPDPHGLTVPMDLFGQERQKIVSYMSHGGTSEETKKDTALAIPYTSKETFIQWISQLEVGGNTFRDRVTYYHDSVEQLRVLALLSSMGPIISNVGSAATTEFGASSYIGPTRAAGERYYRWQELAVDRLDPKGENFAMYVMSLSSMQQKKFSDILEQNFGYALKAQRESGHASLMLAETGSQSWFNLADVGFGFSQILPVIAQIHASNSRRGTRKPNRAHSNEPPIIAIEQPELHLHPAFQARIADLLATSAISTNPSDNSVPTTKLERRFIVETHSEAFVNRLSELVATGVLSAENVVIYIFDKSEGSGTNVRRADILADGKIDNWPYGFFHYI